MDSSLLQILLIALVVVAVAATVFYLFRRIVLDSANREIDRKIGIAQQISNEVIHTIEPLPRGLGQMFGSAGGLIDRISDLLPDKKQRISSLQQQINNLQQEVINQRLENERLRLRHIDVQSVSQQLRIALLELSGKYDSIEHTRLESFEKSMFSREGFTEYIGIKSAEYKINIGIDLESLRFSFAEGAEQQIRVHGLHQFEIIGFKDLHIHNRLAEIRKTLNSGALRGREIQVIENASDLTRCEQEHTQRLLREIQGPQLLDQYIHINARMALVFLKTMLAPKGYDVVETQLPVSETNLNFYQLCQQLNQQLYQREQVSLRHIRDYEGRIQHLQQQIQEAIFGQDNPAPAMADAFPAAHTAAATPPAANSAPLSAPEWADPLNEPSHSAPPPAPPEPAISEPAPYRYDPLDPLSMPGAAIGNFRPAPAQAPPPEPHSRITRLFSRFTA